MAAIQLDFTLRTSPDCETVDLFGSWDNYFGQLPLSKGTRNSGGWIGCFKFQGTTLEQGQRYWYYYIIDGYYVLHDPAKDSTTEPTTGCKLNILDIPGKTKTASSAPEEGRSAYYSRRISTASIPKGRSLSPHEILAPIPKRPNETRQVIDTQYDKATLEALASFFSRQTISSASPATSISRYDSDESSDISSLTSRSTNSPSPSCVSSSSSLFGDETDYDSDSSSVSSFTSRSTNSPSPSSVSSGFSCCTCERFGITREGGKVKLDCGGANCGYSDDSSECFFKDGHLYEAKDTRRWGVVFRS